MPSGGALIVYESMIDDDRNKNTFGFLMSLNMLIETPGGFDYTGGDCIRWMKDVGVQGRLRQTGSSDIPLSIKREGSGNICSE